MQREVENGLEVLSRANSVCIIVMSCDHVIISYQDVHAVQSCVARIIYQSTKITGGHWPFSVHFSKMANQNIKYQYTKWPIRHDKMAEQFRYSFVLYVYMLNTYTYVHIPAQTYVLHSKQDQDMLACIHTGN